MPCDLGSHSPRAHRCEGLLLKIPFLFRWQTIAVVVAAGKLVAMAILPPSGDLLNWTYGTSIALGFISAGKFPPLPDFGVYLGIEIILAPFYWIWTILPIDHPTLGTVVSGTTPAFCLWFLMKLPIFLSDILTAFLLTRIIRTFNGSDRQCAIGYLSWFANPYNFYWLYFFGAMDVIPVAVVLIGLIFGSTSRWTRCTVATTIAGLLRIYPLVTLPFFLSLTKTKATRQTSSRIPNSTYTFNRPALRHLRRHNGDHINTFDAKLASRFPG